MPKYIDLHFHSVYSEGDFTVKELLQMAKKENIAVMSLTDHNTIKGVPEFIKSAKTHHIKAVPGVEIYTRFRGRGLHLLAYNFNLTNCPLIRALSKLQADNLQKTQRSISNLKKQGFVINEKKIFNSPADHYGIIHILKQIEQHPKNRQKIAKELPAIKQGLFDKIDRYFGIKKPGHLALAELPTTSAIDIIKKSHGLAILAHPGQQLFYENDKMIFELVKAGLDGLEIISPYHTWHQVEHYQNLALKYKLLMTGGSDYHGNIDFSRRELIKRQWDYFKVPYVIYNKLSKHLT